MSDAYMLASNKHGTPEDWGIIGSNSPEGAENALNMMAPYLKITKNCGVNPGCFPDVVYKTLGGGNNPNYNTDNIRAKAIMADGMLFAILARSGDCTDSRGPSQILANTCAQILVDTNGAKPPNTLGLDTFYFYLSKYGVIPIGTQEDTFYTFPSSCDKSNSGKSNGCAAWILFSGNMDYLHCNNLSWTGPTQCK